jgi:hypothetical protein
VTFFETQGVRLERAAIQLNASKRGIAKLCLNSMWDKMTKRTNRTKTKMISDPQEVYRYLAMLGIEVANLLLASDKIVLVSWRYIIEVIGAFVTAGARLHLYPYLYRLQEKALYFDTDSVFYVQRDSETALIPCGDKLGDMISELKPCEHVSEFVSAGPKNCAHKIANSATGETKTVCKVRGVTLNYSARHYINFEVITTRHCHGS